MFDINNFAIDHVIRGIMTSKADGSYMWSVNNITDPSLKATTEKEEVVDALGVPITSFNRSKKIEFSASNSLFDLGLYAAQNGTQKQVASSSSKIVVPAYEIVEASGNQVTLKHTPKETIKEIFILNGDGTLGKRFTPHTAASSTQFVISGTTLQFPTGLNAGTELFIPYEYETTEGVAVTVDSKNFPRAGRFVMEVIGSDVCDTTTKIHAFVIIPNAKLDGAVDISFTTTGKHPFTINANQDYCDKDKVLVKIVVPKED